MFNIDPDNNISYGGEGESFVSLAELNDIATAREWSKKDVTEIWNSFAGVAGHFADLRPVKMFRNRPYGLSAIWKAIQRLKPSTTETPRQSSATVEEMKPKTKPAKPKTPPKKAAASTRKATKRDELIRLVGRKNGATSQELQEAMGWLPHSLRGAISTINSKGHAKIESEKHPTRGLVYRIAS